MALKVYRGVTPGTRFKLRVDLSELTQKPAEKALTLPLPRRGGRSKGRVSVRGRSGGAKKFLRVIDFTRNKKNIPAQVRAIEYDPSRSANAALLVYADGEKRYILAPDGLKVGETILTAENAELKPGNALPMAAIPAGMPIHNIELVPGKGGQIVRSAGAAATILAKEDNYVQIRLPSKEVRRVHSSCYATIGQVGNLDHKNIKLGKAGAARHLGRKSKVRGVAQDPGSHPHGGGEGRSGIGMPSPKSPWGKKTLGKKTRRRKLTNKYIIQRRKK